jgi:hypothetical protein
MVMPDPTPGPAPAVAAPGGVSEVRIYQHSPILYWWVIWAYGFVCALLTYTQGIQITLSEGSKPLYIDPSPWVGLSFTILLLFVIVATNVRARGMHAILLLLIIGLAVAGIYLIMNMPGLFATPPSLLVHMNLAFYLLVSSVLFIVWLAVVCIFDRMSYWRFRGTQIERVQKFAGVIGKAPEGYSVMNVKLIRHSDDLLAHKILGLGILGLGTSDIEGRMVIFGGAQEQFRISHVWRAAGPLRQIQTLMGQKATVVI